MPVTVDLLPQLLEISNQWLSHPLITFLQVGCDRPHPPPLSSPRLHECAAPLRGSSATAYTKVD